MKNLSGALLIILSLSILTGCRGRSVNESPSTDTVLSVPDTGFTGIQKGMSGRYTVNEVTLKNGVREGLTKTFYQSGRLRSEKWYRNGLLQDSVIWYYEEGQVFRISPYKNDTIDGIQKQYYRTGQLKARIGYKKGFRTPLLEEFTREGKMITGYPEVIVNTRDEYKTKGIYTITVELSDKKRDVSFYRGDFMNGVYDTTKFTRLKTVNKIGQLTLKKTPSADNDHAGIISEILTNFGNRMLVYKRIELPYKDLN